MLSLWHGHIHFTLSSGYQTIRPFCALGLWCWMEKNQRIVLHHFLKQKSAFACSYFPREYPVLDQEGNQATVMLFRWEMHLGKALARQIIQIGWSVFGSRAATEYLPMFADTDGWEHNDVPTDRPHLWEKTVNMAINLEAGREAVGAAQCWASEMHKRLGSVYTWRGFFCVSAHWTHCHFICKSRLLFSVLFKSL